MSNNKIDIFHSIHYPLYMLHKIKRGVKKTAVWLNRLILILVILIVILFTKANFKNSTPAYTRLSSPPDICTTTDTLNHLYHPFRFSVYNHCVSVWGTAVGSESDENDGDFKFKLKVDAPYSGVLNIGNRILTGGNLIVEVVCAVPAHHTYEKEACKNYKNKVYLPKIGERVKVVGQHVLDIPHGWNEIHPAYLITHDR